MEYTEYTAGDGRCALTLPVFHGEDAACRMNGFYKAALDTLWNYGSGLTEQDRRCGFFCSPEILEENGILTVILHLTYRRPGKPSLRKNVIHHWKDGYLYTGRKISHSIL